MSARESDAGRYNERMSLGALLLAAALFPQGPPAPAAETRTLRPAPPRPDLSWAEADELAATMARLERRVKAGKPASRTPLVVTERQLNSYLLLSLGPRIPPGIQDLRIRLEPGGLAASAIVDLARVRERLPQGGASTVLSILQGSLPVEVRARIWASAGTGRLDVDEARLGGISLPPSIVAQLVASATRSHRRPEGFDILTPFALPWTAREIRLQTGRAVLEFAR